MIFTLPRSLFRDAVSASAAVAPSGASMSALECVVIETDMETTVTITGSDTYTTVVTRLQGDIEQRGSCMVNAKAIRDVVASLPESNADVHVEMEGTKLKLKSGKSKRVVACLSSESFPVLAKEPPAMVKMAAPALLRAFSIVEHATGDDPASPQINGINLICGDGQIVAQSTDSHRLAHTQVRCETGAFTCLVPAGGVAAMKRALTELGDANAEIGSNDTHASLRCGNTVTTVRLTGELFASVVTRALALEYTHEARVHRGTLLDRIRRAAIGSKQEGKDRVREMDMTFRDGGILLAATGVVADATDEVDCDYAGPNICTGINPGYAVETLSAMDADEIRVSLIVKNGKVAGPMRFAPLLTNESTFLLFPQAR